MAWTTKCWELMKQKGFDLSWVSPSLRKSHEAKDIIHKPPLCSKCKISQGLPEIGDSISEDHDDADKGGHDAGH